MAKTKKKRSEPDTGTPTFIVFQGTAFSAGIATEEAAIYINPALVAGVAPAHGQSDHSLLLFAGGGSAVVAADVEEVMDDIEDAGGLVLRAPNGDD